MAIWFYKCVLLLGSVFFLHPAEKQESVTYGDGFHPIHMSVTEINHNAIDKTLEISCKLFTDDFEAILSKNYRIKVDLTNPPDKAAMEKLIDDYIHKNLSIEVDRKPVHFTMLGFEKDQDVVYSYFEVENIAAVKKISLVNTIMYDLFNDQISLMHITVGGKRKSGKLDYPEKGMGVEF